MANIVLSILGNAEGANRAVKSVEDSTEGLKTHASKVGGVMAGVFGGGVLLEAAAKVKEFAQESIDKLSDLATETRGLQRVMGGTPEAASTLIAVGGRVGVTADVMTRGMGLAAKAIGTGKSKLGELGIATKDSHGQLRTMADIMPELIDKFENIKNPTERAAKAQEIFGKGGLAMLPMLGMGREKFDEYAKSAKDSGTVIGGDALKSTKEFQQTQKELGEAVEGAQIQIGEKLYPILITITKWITGNVVPAIKAMFEWLSQNKDIIGPIAAVIGSLVGIILAVVAAMKVWAIIQEAVNLLFIENPIGIILIAITVLIVAIVLLVTHWKQVTAFLQTVWAAVCAWFAGSLHALAGTWNAIWGAVASFFRGLWNGLIGWFTGLIKAWVSAQHTEWNGIVSFLHGLWNGFVGFFRGIWNGIVSFVTGVVRNYIAGARTMWSGIISWLRDLFNGYLTFWRGVWGNILSFVTGIPGKIRGVFAGVGSWLVNSGKSLIDGFIGGITASIGGAVKAVSGVVNAVAKFFPHSPAEEGPFSGQGWTEYSGAALIDGFATGAASRTSSLKGTVSGVLGGLVPSLSMQGMGIVGAQTSAAAVAGGLGSGSSGGITINTHQGATAPEIVNELTWAMHTPY